MKMQPKVFTVIVADLVASRSIHRRQQLSQKITSVLDRISIEFRKEFYARLILIRGMDELSGVLKSSNMSYLICRLLNERIYPHLFRFAIVKGPLDTAVASRDARRMDGPAFHLAADMIQKAKKKNLFYSFDLGFKNKEFHSSLNGLTNLIHALRSRWTDHQRRVVHLYEQLNNQKAVARKLSITQQAVSSALRQADWKIVKQAEDIVSAELEKSDLIQV